MAIATNASTQQIVFIDSGVQDYQLLAQGVLPGIETVILNSESDGIQQITSVLSQNSNLTTIHIVAHGSPGCIYLGNSQLSLDTLNKYREKLKIWFSQSPSLPISPSLDTPYPTPHTLLIYGCNVAAGDAGEEFIAKLHDLTGAEIAASTTPVGNAALGGNWELDVTTKEIDSNLAFTKTVQKNYSEVFVTVTYNDDPNVNTNIPNLNTDIPDADTTGISKTFNVTENLNITDINIGLNITHTFRGDLDITLRHPDGTVIELTTDNGDGVDNLYVLFDDSASTNITADNNTHNTAGFTNLRIPEQALSTFNNRSSVGTWTLTIADDAGGDIGTYNSSQLTITGNPPPLSLDLDGSSGANLGANLDGYAISSLDGVSVNIADSDAAWNGTNNVNTLTLDISGLEDGADEILTIGGTDFSLNTDTTTTATVGGTTFNIAATNGGTTFTLTNNAGGSIPTADVNTLLSDITYRNDATNITSNPRTINVTATDTSNASETVTSTIATVTPGNETPIDGGNGAIYSSHGKNNIYSVDVTTGKATILTTSPFASKINSLASDVNTGLVYYVNSTNSPTNVALYAYDAFSDVHFVVDDNVINNGVAVGDDGIGAAGAGFDNGFLYLGVEEYDDNGTGNGTTDRVYKIDFEAASNGRVLGTAQNVLELETDWGDFAVDGDTLYNFSSIDAAIRQFNLASATPGDPVDRDELTGISQVGQDVNGNLYNVGNSIRSFNPTTDTLGTAVDITTNGTTLVGGSVDAAQPVQAVGTIGNLIFSDVDGDGIVDAGRN